MYERYGHSHRVRAFTFIPLIHQWLVIQAQSGRIF
jgi:hypothetical protein